MTTRERAVIFSYRMTVASLLALSLCHAGHAYAQQSAPAMPAPAAKEDTTTVTVKGKKSQNRADRQVYDVSKNPDSQTASVADTLGKLPGVNVDPSGNVTLRGQDVRIYLNGRPSLMLSGDNRGQALQAMPSALLGSVEIISNPGAQFASDSADPIINLVTKRKGPTGVYGSVTVRANSTGRGEYGTWMSYTRGNLSLTFDPSYYASITRGRQGLDLQAFDPAHGLTTETRSHNRSMSRDRGVFVGTNLEYALGKDDAVTASFNYNHGIGYFTGDGHTVIYDGAGQAKDIHASATSGDYIYGSRELTFGYTHYGRKPDETLKIDGSLSSQRNRNDWQSDITYALSPVPANTGTRVDTKSRDGNLHSARLSADYNTELGDDQVALGMQIVQDESVLRIRAFGPDALGTPPTPQPLLNSVFGYRQTVSAVYGTYQREFTGALTVLGGLRAESWHLSAQYAGGGTGNRLTYTQINPSLFATYVLSPKRKLRFSYVRHQQRPDPADLNPGLIYNSPTAVALGNPDLKPQLNDTVESAYEYQGDKLSYTLRSFYRRDDHLIARSSAFIPDPQKAGNLVVETTHVNYGFQTADGLSANFNDRISDKLSLSGDATLTFSALRNPEITWVQRGTSLGGSTTLTYSFAQEDEISITYKLAGKSFYGIGMTPAYSTTSLQYKHPLTSKLDLLVAFDNLMRAAKTERITATPLIHALSVSSSDAPTFYIAITRHFSRLRPAASDN